MVWVSSCASLFPPFLSPVEGNGVACFVPDMQFYISRILCKYMGDLISL